MSHAPPSSSSPPRRGDEPLAHAVAVVLAVIAICVCSGALKVVDAAVAGLPAAFEAPGEGLRTAMAVPSGAGAPGSASAEAGIDGGAALDTLLDLPNASVEAVGL